MLIREEPAGPDEENRTLGARTDDAGHFSITQISPGRYRLRAAHNGYVAGMYGATRREAPGTVLALTAGQHIQNANVALLPSAAIEGRVVDENGEPAFGADWEARVYALATMLRRRGLFNSDELRSAIERLPPEQYLAASYYERWLGALEMLVAEKGALP